MTKSNASSVGAALDLGERVAQKLKEIAERDLAGELADKLAQDRPKLSKALSRVLSKAGLGKIQEFLERAATSLETNKTLQQLTGPVADIPRKGIGWAWQPKLQADLPGKGSVTPALKGSVQGSARILQGPGYSFRGALKAVGAVKSPLPVGSLSSRAERSVRGSFRVDFLHPGDMRVVDAVCMDLPVISRLGDPGELLNAEAFRKATLEFTSGVRLGAEFRATNSLVGSIAANRATLSTRLQTRVRYAVYWNRQGRFKLGIRRLKSGRLRLRLTDAQEVRNRRSLSLGAEVRVRGLQKAVAPVMERITELPEGLEELVGTYSQPSRIFERKFREKMKLLDAPAQKLLGVVSGSRSAEDLADGLAGAILDVTRSRTGEWTGMLDGKVDAVVEKTLAKVEIARDREEEIAALVKDKARDAVDSLNDEMKERLADVLEARSGVDAIGAALAQFAEVREDAAEEIDKKAAAFLAPFTRLLAHYRATEERLRDAVEAAAKAKLAVKFARVVSRERKAQALLVFDLDPRDAQAEQLYREMLTGDFRAAMKAASGSPDGAITLRNSVFKRVFDDEETSGITFDLFGLNISSERKLSARIKVEHGLGGQIRLFEAEGSVSEEVAAFGEGQSMRVDSALNFLAAADSTDALAVHLNYTDADMTEGEMREYVQSLEDAELLAEGAALRLAESDDEFAVRDGAERLMSIDTQFTLTRAAFQKISEASDERIVRTAISQQLQAYGRIEWSSESLGLFADFLGDFRLVEKLIYELRGIGRRRLKEKLGLASRVRSEQERKIRWLVWGIADRAKALAGFIDHWRQLKGLRLTIDQHSGVPDETQLAEARNLHSDMLADLRSWVDARSPLVGIAREDLSPIAAAFLASLRELSGQQAEPLTPVLKRTTDDQSQYIAIA